MIDREAFEERAAILQYDAGLSKAEAESKSANGKTGNVG